MFVNPKRTVENIQSAAKTLISKRDYVSTRPENFGHKYTRYGGVISIMNRNSKTPESVAEAKRLKQAEREAKRDAMKRRLHQ